MKQIIQLIHQQAKSDPDATAIYTAQQTISYRELIQSLTLISADLNKHQGKRLAIYLENSIDWLLIDLAAAMAGLTVIPIPLYFSLQQRQHLLQDAGVDLIATSGQLASSFGDAIPDCNNANLIQSTQTYLLEYQAKTSAQTLADNTAKITYTSGSTGQSKGVCLSNNTIDQVTIALNDALNSSELQRHLCLLPFATLLENIAGLYRPLINGSAVVIDEVANLGLTSNHVFDAQHFVNAVNTWQADSAILLPQMLKSITEFFSNQISIKSADGDLVSAELIGDRPLPSMKFMAVGGGKVSPQSLQQCMQLGLPVFEGYGLSECGSVVSLNVPGSARVGSVGKPLGHVNVLADVDSNITIRGNAMSGYLGDSDECLNVIDAGDIGHIDEDGFLYITGRKKNIIVSSFGRNVSPEWVESQFVTHESIFQIAVFGEAEPHLNAVIVYQQDSTLALLPSIIDEINQTLPDYAQIKSWQGTTTPFSEQDGTLTNNGKLKREAISQFYTQDTADFNNISFRHSGELTYTRSA